MLEMYILLTASVVLGTWAFYNYFGGSASSVSAELDRDFDTFCGTGLTDLF